MSEEKADKAIMIAKEADHKIDTHEQVCAERYSYINTTMTEIRKELKEFKEHISSTVGKIRKDVNWYVITTLATVLLMSFGVVGYLWMELENKKNEQIKRVTTDQVSEIQEQLGHIINQIDKVKKK